MRHLLLFSLVSQGLGRLTAPTAGFGLLAALFGGLSLVLVVFGRGHGRVLSGDWQKVQLAEWVAVSRVTH